MIDDDRRLIAHVGKTLRDDRRAVAGIVSVFAFGVLILAVTFAIAWLLGPQPWADPFGSRSDGSCASSTSTTC